MATVSQILGDDFALLQGQGKSNDEIISIAKERLKNPPQIVTPQQVTTQKESKTKDIPEWLKGESGNGLIDFGQDVLRGSTKTFLNYANLYNKATGGDTSRSTELLQKLDKITEDHKAKNRTPDRVEEVKKLNENYANAKGFKEKFGAGVDSIVDTLATPSEWQVGEFIGENSDIANLIPIGRGVVAGATLGAIVNGGQASAFAGARDDKTAMDVYVEGALGATAGGVLGGATGGLTKRTSVPNAANEYSAAREWTGFGKEKDAYDKAGEALGVEEDPKYARSAYYRDNAKVGEDGMLSDPFNKSKNPLDENIDPIAFEAEIVKKRTYETFGEIITDEEATVKAVDADIKQLGYEMQQAGATQNEIELEVAQKLLPSPEAIAITTILNDGAEITPRLNGLNMQQAIINSINNPLKTKEQFYESMVGYGATQEHALVATKAYETKEIAHYSTWAHDKLTANIDKLVDVEAVKIEAQKDIQSISKVDTKDNSYTLAHEALPIEETRTTTQQSALFGNEQQLFDVPSETKLKTPSWAKNLVSDTVKYEDIVKDITDAKNGAKPTALAKRAMLAQAKNELKSLKTHNRYSEVLDFTRDNEGTQSPQRLESSKKVSTVDNPDGFKTNVDQATYSKNYQYDFTLTKAKVKRIEEGKATLNDIQSLKADLDMIENNPTYALPTEAELKARYEEQAANPEMIFDYAEFDKLEQKFDPELYAEKQEMFGTIKEEEFNNDTDYTRDLARDSSNAEARDTTNETTDANGGGTDRTSTADAPRVNGAEELAKQSNNSTPNDPTTLLRESSDTKLSKTDEPIAASGGAAADIKPERSSRDDGGAVQTKQRRKAATSTKPKQKPEQSDNADVGTTTAEIKDFGEKIGGARKDLFVNSNVDTSKFGDFTANELFKTVKKNKVFKAIDYREFAKSFDADKLYASSPDLYDAIGITPAKAPLLIAHFVKTIKDSIQTPKSGWSTAKFKSYVEGVEIVKKYLSEAKGMSDFKEIRTAMFGADIIDGRYINSSAKNYEAYSALGSKFNSALSFGTYDIRKSARAVKQGWMSEGESKSTSSKFDVGEDALTGEFFVKRKKATWNGNLVADGFKTEDDAINFINTYEKQEKFRIYKSGDEYEIGRRYADGRYAKLKEGFASEAEARKHLVDNIDDLSKMKADDIAKRPIVDVMTYGQDHRGGKDISPENFSDTFGFRGIEFGNWNSQSERQLHLNRAYDGLSDLADLLDIPQRAISLNGDLALAFGARGTGGKNAASAHYEPDRVVINLTKKSGAGTLAHEWAHALDNYFGKKAKSGYLTDNFGNGNVRSELFEMWKEVIEIARRRDATDAEMRENFTNSIESSTKRLESAFDTLEKQLKTVATYKKNARAATAAELKTFQKMKDNFINNTEQMEATSYKAGRIKTAEADAFNAFYKKIKGNAISESTYNTLSSVGSSLRAVRKNLADLDAGTAEPYKTNTNFLNEAKELDKARTKPYWSTKIEMFARAFEAYVGDRLAEKGIKSSYLVSGEHNPLSYPMAEERVAINNALHKLQEEMKFRESDNSHVELYAEVIPGIRKVVTWLDNWDEKVDAVYDAASNFARGVDSDGNLKAKVPSDYKIINWAKNLGDFLQENFVLGGARSDKLIDMTRNLNNHKSTIMNDAIKMRAGLNHLTKQDNQSLVRALGGDMEATELNNKLRPIYNKFRKIIDDQTDALVAAGALDPKYARENYLKRYYFDHVKEDSFFDIFKGGIANTDKFKRKEMSLADRIAKGQIEDAGFVIAKTILEQRDQLLKAEFFQKLNDAYGVEKMQDAYVQVPDIFLSGNIKKFGALNGKFVPYEVYENIKASFRMKEDLGNIEKAANLWVKSVQHIKTNMTVKNAGTHLYNVLSNGYIAYLDGHYTQLARILKDKTYYDKLKSEASRFGLDTMLDDMESQFFKEHNPNESALMKIYKNAYMAEGSLVGDKMRQAYEFEDVAFKLAAYAKRREALQFNKFLESRPDLKDAGVINDMYNAHKYRDEIKDIELSETELEAAFKEVDSIYVNYGTSLPKGVAGLDRSGLMPFLHYSWKATPIFVKLMAKHPFKVAALHVAFAGFGASKIIGDEDERDKITPAWMNDGINILGVDNYAELSEAEYLNIGRSVPGMRFLNMSPVSVFLGQDGGILANVIGISTTGVDNKGYSVDGRMSDTALQKLASRASALSESISPPLFPAVPTIVRQKRDSRGKELAGETEVVAIGGRYFQKAYDAIGGKKDKRGNPLEVTDVIKQALGLKLQKVDKLENAQKSVNKSRKTFVREYNMAKSAAQRAAAKKKYKEEIKSVKEQLPRKEHSKLKIKTSLPNAKKSKIGNIVTKQQMIKF